MTVELLRTLGHDVKDLRGTPDQGIADSLLWALAAAESRAIITTDKGFTEYRSTPHQGMLIVRLRQPNRRRIHNSVMRALETIPEADWPNTLVVMRDSTMSTSRARTEQE